MFYTFSLATLILHLLLVILPGEIMQLFSTGLYLLNIDGTPKLDENNQPITVYTNDEIMSFARIWTGFDYQQGRGNVEEASWSGNRHDPMRIQGKWMCLAQL